MAVTRVADRFAWWPVRLDDGSWCMLQWYVSHETWIADNSGWATGWWQATRRTREPHSSRDTL